MGVGSENSAQRQFGEAAAATVLAAVEADTIDVERWEVTGPRWTYDAGTPAWLTTFTCQLGDSDIVLSRREANTGGVTAWIEVLAPDGAVLGLQYSSKAGATVSKLVEAVADRVERRLVSRRINTLTQLEQLTKPGRDLG